MSWLAPEEPISDNRVCRVVYLPDNPAFLRAFDGAMLSLTKTYHWQQTGVTTPEECAAAMMQTFFDISERCPDDIPEPPPPPVEEKGGCTEYYPDSHVFEFQPHSPFTDPYYQVSPYKFSPWYAIGGENIGLVDIIPTVEDGDVFTDLSRISANPLDWPDFVKRGFPRFKVKFTGKGVVELHLRRIPQGGIAAITLDGSPLSKPHKTAWVDLSSMAVIDLDSYLAILNTIFGAFAGTLTGMEIIEIPVEDSGDHFIEVWMIPTFSTDVLLGFGGGVHKVVFCGKDIRALPCPDCPEVPDCNCEEADCGCCDDDPDDDCGCCDEETDDCGCCEENDMARTGIKDIKLVGGKLIKVLCDGTEEVVGDITGKDTPTDVPEPDEGQPPTADNACYKANAVWQVISDFAEALIQTIETEVSPYDGYIAFQSNYPSLDEDNWQLFKFLNQHFSDDVGSAWEANKDALKNAFVCAMADKFDKTPRLSDVEISYIKTFDFDSQSGDLDGFLTDVRGVPENAFYKRQAAMYAESQLGECNCGGAVEPEPPETYDWCYTWDFTQSSGSWGYRYDGATPEGEYQEGVGHKAIENSNYTRLTLGRPNISRVVTGIDVHYENITLGNYQEGEGYTGLPNRNFNIYSGETVYFSSNIPAGQKTYRWRGYKSMESLQIMLTVAYDSVEPVTRGGSATLTRITLYGLGSNPFGTDNCE